MLGNRSQPCFLPGYRCFLLLNRSDGSGTARYGVGHGQDQSVHHFLSDALRFCQDVVFTDGSQPAEPQPHDLPSDAGEEAVARFVFFFVASVGIGRVDFNAYLCLGDKDVRGQNRKVVAMWFMTTLNCAAALVDSKPCSDKLVSHLLLRL